MTNCLTKLGTLFLVLAKLGTLLKKIFFLPIFFCRPPCRPPRCCLGALSSKVVKIFLLFAKKYLIDTSPDHFVPDIVLTVTRCILQCDSENQTDWKWKIGFLSVWTKHFLPWEFCTPGGATPNTNILMQTCFFPNALHCNVGKGFPPEIQQLTQFQFSISFSYSVGLFPRRVNHRARAPGGHRGDPCCFYLMRFSLPF